MAKNNHQSVMENNSAFMAKMEDLVKELVLQNNIPFYRIESIMEHHFHPNGSTYMPVVRVITYFEDAVANVANVISKEFDIYSLPNKDNNSSANGFNSKMVQYLTSLKANRQSMIEYRRTANIQFQIQICSMLQDAWVGIEKELGYENGAYPENLKRDLYRVSALLEMADLEFMKIRGLLKPHQTAMPNIAPQPAVAPQPQPIAYSAPVAAPQPEVKPQEQPIPNYNTSYMAAEVDEVIKPIISAETATNTDKISLDTLEINVKKSDDLSLNVNEVGETNGVTEENVNNLMKVTDNGIVEDTNVSESSTSGNSGDGVALNIDKIETFNMNVNGMIERVTEGKGADGEEEDENVPFYNREPKAEKPAPLDENSPMTDATLKEYVGTSKVVKEVDSEIAKRAGASLNSDVDVEGDVERLRFLKIFTVKQLHERILDNKEDIIAFAEKWIGKDNGGSFDSGICLFYLEYLLVGKKNDPAFAVEYVLKFISDNDYSARFIIPTYNAISKNEQPIASHLTLKK